MGRWTKCSSLVLALLVSCCCMTVASSDVKDQTHSDTTSTTESIIDDDHDNSTDSRDDDYFSELLLDPGCEMKFYNETHVRTISIEDYAFHPVISMFYSGSSITIHTEANNSYPLNSTGLPRDRPLASRFDVRSSTFKIMLSPLVSVNLTTAEGLNDTINRITFKDILMTNGNCTSGLPFYNDTGAFLNPDVRMELLLLSTQEGGVSHIRGYGFTICNDGGMLSVRDPGLKETQENCNAIPARIPHLLTFNYDKKTGELKMNGTWIGQGVFARYIVFFKGNYSIVVCVFHCPRANELNTLPGNTTKKGIKMCVPDLARTAETFKLVVCVSILLFTLMVADGSAMIMDYVYRRFYQPPEQDPNNLQWHLITRPIPAYWQIPPPLPERSPPSLPGSTLRRRLVVEEEDDSD